MIITIIILIAIIIALSVALLNKILYFNKEDKIKFEVWNYYSKYYHRYGHNKWIDVVLDYCNERHKQPKDIFPVFDITFLHSETFLV